jgi:holliday junction DNA helicase RuvA
MYDQLCGDILKKTPASLVIEVQGVGFFLEASLRTTGALAAGATARVLVHHRQSEDSVRLFGFIDDAERDLFRSLLKISGVGPAHALALLSASAPEELWVAIRDGNERRLTASKGIGPKIAQRLITELKDEAARRAPGGKAAAAGGPTPTRDATEEDAAGALVTLGYTDAGAMKAVQAARKKFEKPPAVDELVRQALKER